MPILTFLGVRGCLALGLLLALLAGWWYVGHLRSERDFYQAQAQGLQKLNLINQARENVRRATEKRSHEIDQKVVDGDAAGLADDFNRLSDPDDAETPGPD